MKTCYTFAAVAAGLLFLCFPAASQEYVADHTVDKEEVLRSIPREYIDKARKEFVIAYQHTSHGTHVSRGVFGLQDYKPGDRQLFGVSESVVANKLEFRDYALEDYAPQGVDGSDLSKSGAGFVQTTRNYLDDPKNATVNVVMWSWCNIVKRDVKGMYLKGMSELISEYGEAGTKIGTAKGQRKVPVKFIFMTGHPNLNWNSGPYLAKQQAATINNYCNANAQYCLDYYAIDTHTMDGVYYEDSGEDTDSDSYGGIFNLDWQNAHTLGEDYFENKRNPDGSVSVGSHTTQHITGNRKAYAMWWILARMAGWDGVSAVEGL